MPGLGEFCFLMGMNEVKALGTHPPQHLYRKKLHEPVLTSNLDEFCCSSHSDKPQGPLIVLPRKLEGSKSDCPEI